ncbi:hypothetical protein Ac2012v2_007730 [Leucoagaricus gongylophorus]
MAVKPPQPSCGNPVAFTGGQSPSSVVNYIGAYSTPAQSLHSGRSKTSASRMDTQQPTQENDA